MSIDFDAYKTLQVDPQADDVVVEAAFRALARLYDPDTKAGDSARLADINRAYDLLRTPVRRRRYDRERKLKPVGPGSAPATPASSEQPSPPTNGAAPRAVRPVADYEAPTRSNGRPQPAATAIDFGRYRGWSLKDLAKHDPDYLRWLARSSGGYRYRNAILQLLPDEPEPDPGKLTRRHRS